MITINWREAAGLLALAVTIPGCQDGKARIVRNRDSQVLSAYQLKSVSGFRDGDRLYGSVVFTSRDATLTMEMKFLIGVPTKLENGSYSWLQGNQTTKGAVTATAVTFLGGQDGPPSLGGTFQLVASDAPPLYEVRLPTTVVELKKNAPAAVPPFKMP